MENNQVNQESTDSQSGFIQMKKFHFVMLLFLVVFLSAGITTFALAFGDEKAVPVATERQEFEKLYNAFDKIKESYYKEINQDALVNGAINGMVEALDDPYSDYMNEQETEGFQDTINSSFEGIGAEIQEKDGSIVIVSPIKESPADKAGLEPNDVVLSVDGKSLQGMSSTEAVKLIRGEKGTKVKLSIQRSGIEDPFEITIERDTIPIETVYGEMIDDKIAKVQITSFSKNTSTELVKELNELQKEGMEGLVLDLRQNPGGLLDEAIKIANLFLPDGEVILKVEDRDGNIQEMKSSNTESPDIPLVVVIDKGSASASEILAAAVHESANVSLVGENSFGKGTVQSSQSFPDGSNIKITTKKWLTPNEEWIHEKGIEPDYKVSLPDYANLSIINPDVELKLSTTSAQVKSAQAMLKAIGYNPGREDGFFDEKTKKAVIKFQKSENLEETGVLKGETSRKLMEKLSEKINNNDTQIQKAVEVLKEQMSS